MSFVAGTSGKVVANEVQLSAYVSGWSATHRRAVSEVTCLPDSGARFVPGLLGGAVNLQGFFDSDAGAINDEVTSTAGVNNGLLVTILPEGWTVGNVAFTAVTDLENYTVSSTVSEAVGVAVDGMPDDGVDWGVVLHGLTAETADASATSVDNGSSSTGGAVAALHVTAYSGLTNAVVTVEHSTNNSVWSTLITFSTATATTSERKTVTGTVNRYVRATVDVTGTGSVTPLVAFARR